MSLLANSNAIESGGYNIDRSLRFRSSASAYLNRTQASGNRQIFTWSSWFKMGSITGGTGPYSLFGCNSASIQSCDIYQGQLRFYVNPTSSGILVTSQVFRDPSAWYHLVIAVDTTQATAANRIKIYVNGSQVTAFGTSTYPAQNFNYQFNTASVGMTIGQESDNAAYFDGYMAEVNWIDGQQLAPTSFGQTDAVTGVWVPKKYTGTYGTNGFYLDFKTNTSATTLAYDKSGNGNNWTPNNISTTAGTTYDSMTDVPTLTSATAANFATLNPIGYGYQFSSSYASSPSLATGASLTQGNLYATGANAGTGYYGSWVGTIPLDNGKWYWEALLVAEPTADFSFPGIVRYDNGTTNAPYLASNGSYTVNDLLGFTWDDTAKELKWYKNGTLQSTIVTGATGSYLPFVGLANANVMAFNFGQRPFSYTPPTGFKALNTYNLPDPTIKKPNQYMDATTFTGTGGNTSVTNAGTFQPDLVWAKGRSTAQNNWLVDSVRGANNVLFSNLTNAEGVGTGVITAFNSNGFNIDASFTNAATYVGWQWKAGGTPATTNTSGSITSTVSVNPTAGFSVVTWAGNSVSGATFGHGLGIAPKLVITKSRTNLSSWVVGIGNISGFSVNDYLVLQSTAAKGNSSTFYQAYGSSTLTVGVSAADELNKTGNNYVTYLFAEIAGFSKFGSYTGNGSTDGPFVYCGFRPKFVLIKSSSVATTDWYVQDATVNPSNVVTNYLYPNLSSAEQTNGLIDFTSNGFKIRNNYAPENQNGGTYIFAAFAQNPFKFANAR